MTLGIMEESSFLDKCALSLDDCSFVEEYDFLMAVVLRMNM
jgi:hypothetical protein